MLIYVWDQLLTQTGGVVFLTTSDSGLFRCWTYSHNCQACLLRLFPRFLKGLCDTISAQHGDQLRAEKLASYCPKTDRCVRSQHTSLCSHQVFFREWRDSLPPSPPVQREQAGSSTRTQSRTIGIQTQITSELQAARSHKSACPETGLFKQ